jgi:hypothetical protein
LAHNDVDTSEGVVGHNDTTCDHGAKVELLGTLRTISHGENELRADKQNAYITKDDEEIEANIVAKGINGWIGERTGDEIEGKVEVGQGEVGKKQVDKLIDELDVQENLTADGMVCPPDLTEVDK